MSAPSCTPIPSLPKRTTPTGLTLDGSNEPLAGVHASVITIVTQRVARRLRDEAVDVAQSDAATSLLAAIALAVVRRHPDFVSMLLPRPSAQLGQRLVEMLHTELLRCWAEGRSQTPPSDILDALTGLEQVRLALAQKHGLQLHEGFTGADALELFVDAAHDLRSPLSAILFLAETLHSGRSGEVNKTQHRQLGLIYSAALGLSGLVNDALDLANDGQELADSEPAPLSLSELLESAADIARPMAEEKGLLIRLSGAEPDRRLGRPVALSRVLLNLTTNALKFTDQGSVDISCAATGPTRIEFSVRDTGPGIPPQALESLYLPFRRARARADSCFSGTGLGLAITRKLVAALGSRLRVETGSLGTRFYFELDLPVLPHP